MKPASTNAIVRFAALIPCTLTVATLALAAAFVPGLSDAWQFDRMLIQSGELFRAATCHLTHWNLEHLQWDLLMFVVLGAISELRSRRQMQACVVIAGAAVSTLVFTVFPTVATYRGLSGIDTALFMLLAVSLMIEAYRFENRRLLFTTAALIIGLCLKTTYELVAHQAFFVNQSEASFEILVWDHIVAGTIGGCIAAANAFACYWSNARIASVSTASTRGDTRDTGVLKPVS